MAEWWTDVSQNAVTLQQWSKFRNIIKRSSKEILPYPENKGGKQTAFSREEHFQKTGGQILAQQFTDSES